MRSLRPLFVLITALMLALASMSIATPATAQADGFHGDVKIHQEPGVDAPIVHNEPQVCSPFSIHGFGFDASAHGWWKIIKWQPTGDNTTIALQDTDWGPASASGEWSSDELQLPDGHYKLEYEQTNPSVPGNLKHKAFWVDCGTQPGEGTVGVFKYNDADGNGHRDNGHPEVEPGLPGWTFTIQQIVDDALVGPVSTITTGSDGNGDFGSFPRGMYRVCETPQNGWTNTDPGELCQDVGVLGDQHYTVTFGNQAETPESGIRVWKYNDLDNDGSWDKGTEPGLVGWHFTITPVGGQAQDVVTDATGQAYLDVPAGDYVVSENLPLPAYWTNTEPGGATPHYDLTVTEGTKSEVEFGNHYFPPLNPTPTPTPPGTLQIVKYNDLDRNGSRGSAEPVLSGFSFQVKAGATVQATLTTSAAGTVSLTLLPGVYSVSELALTGWVNTDPGGTAPTKTVTITSGQVSTLVFGNATVIVPPTSQTQITIVKYSDANGNGTRDSGEGTLAGFNFVVKASDGSVVGTATTGSDGTAAIVGLPLGPYTITETPLTGWTNTDPGGAAIKVAVLAANATTATVSFGNAQIRLPSTSTEDGTTNGLLALVLAGAGVAMLVVARRTSHTV